MELRNAIPEQHTTVVPFGNEQLTVVWHLDRWTNEFAATVLPKLNNVGMLAYLVSSWSIEWGVPDEQAYKARVDADPDAELHPPVVAGHMVPITTIHMSLLPVFFTNKVAEAVAEDMRNLGKLSARGTAPG